jgi:hypothetical protein
MSSPVEDFNFAWPHLKKALRLTGGTHTKRDIFDGIMVGDFQLWRSRRSSALTEVVRYPQLRSVRVFLAGGDLEELKTVEQKICAWAKEIGAKRVEIAGRRGWLKALDSYTETCTWMQKEIDSNV